MRRLFAACLGISLLAAAPPPRKTLELRHFREDHLTGADYLRVSSIGTYEVIGREHMGIWMLDHGAWSEKEGSWHFVSAEAGASKFSGRVVKVDAKTFIVWKGEDGPGIEVPEAEVRADLAKNKKQLPPYVFFEISKATFERETERKYPFKYFPELNRGK